VTNSDPNGLHLPSAMIARAEAARAAVDMVGDTVSDTPELVVVVRDEQGKHLRDRSVGASARALSGRPEPRCPQGVDLSEGHQKVAPPTSVSETPSPSYLAPLFRAGLFCELGGRLPRLRISDERLVSTWKVCQSAFMVSNTASMKGAGISL
jgi:hypothetical protein